MNNDHSFRPLAAQVAGGFLGLALTVIPIVILIL